MAFALGLTNRFLNGTIDHFQARQALSTVLILMWLRMINSFFDLDSHLTSVWMLIVPIVLLWGNHGESIGTLVCQNIWGVIQGFGGMYGGRGLPRGSSGVSLIIPAIFAPG